jgi:endonuclease/exonuclease/phosphatase family metal-dependent hydrolase
MISSYVCRLRRESATFVRFVTPIWTLLAFALLPADAAEPTRLRVLTYNIHHAEGTDGKIDYQRLAGIITGLEPDVVALQEVDRNTERTGREDQAARLAELTGMRHAFGTAMHYSGGQYGEAILSRFSIIEHKSHPLPFRYGQEPRAALAARIRPENGLPEFLFVGTHLCHQSGQTRTDQARQLDHLFGAESDYSKVPVVLAGDLNARPGSEPMRVLLENGWIDAIAPQSVIDYVLFRESDPWHVVEVQIIDDRVASDHRPVLAVLEWQGK